MRINEEEKIADAILVNHLLHLHNVHDEKNTENARGKLASLRYAVRDRLHEQYSYNHVIPAFKFGSLTENEYRNEWRTLIAGLFGYSHDAIANKPNISMGHALRSLYNDRTSASLESRFMALLDADDEHLPGHLFQAIALLKTMKENSIGLDWKMLLEDICQWNLSDKRTQKKWVKHYYHNPKAQPADLDEADKNSE